MASELSSLAGAAGDRIRGQATVAGASAYLSGRWLVRYFETRMLTPFAISCLIAGAASIPPFAIGQRQRLSTD